MIRVLRAHTNRALWDRCVDAFLEGHDGSALRHPSWIWLSHRNLRDRLLETAHARRHPGWLDPPIAFFGDLARLFEIRERPVGLLTRRRILSRHAARLGRDILDRTSVHADGVTRGHMLDAVLGDLLPEGVTPEELEGALARLGGDAFSRDRNRWIVEVYRAYLRELDERGARDWRSVNALLAERVEAGELPRVLRGAGELHIYGMTSARSRRRLLRALARQRAVDVHLYLPLESEPDPFFEGLASATEVLGATGDVDPSADGAPGAAVREVQPAPDAAREVAWVAGRVKRLLAAGEVEPHEVAIVARSGREDTRRAFRALESAGIPATARIRTPLVEIPALKALLLVFRGVGRGWDYRSLRAVLEHPYFDTRVDLRGIDFIAGRRRVEGLDRWTGRLERLRELVEKKTREVRGRGLFPDRLEKDLEGIRVLREALDPLSEPRTEGAWIAATLGLLGDERGIFHLRRRVCDPVEERWDVVRADQRGVALLEGLLREWTELEHPDETLDPAAWHGLLRKLLEANELVLSTPGQKGVQVLEAHDAALVPFAHTFVVHANDGEFPRTARSTGVLSDAERARLSELGLPLSHRERGLRRERSLWRAVTQQAGPVLVSYRTTDAGGTPLLPSLMVPDHDPETELPRVRRPAADREPVTPEGADRLAAARLHEALGRPDPSPGPVRAAPSPVPIAPARPERLRRAIVAGVAEAHRGPGLERYPGLAERPGTGLHPAFLPNPWNGELRDPDVLARLERKFDESYRWSASQLEGYARAPFLFLIDRVLWLSGLEEAEEETSPLAFGSVAHEILERFYREHLDELPEALEGLAASRLEEIADAVYREREEEGEWLGIPALRGASREVLRTAVRDYVAWELGQLARKAERPVLIEHRFGFDEEALYLVGRDVHGRRSRLRVCGKIDRIDVAENEAIHHVLDHKSTYTPTLADYQDGTALQGVLYLEALATEGRSVGLARYRSIRKRKNARAIHYDSDAFSDALAIAHSIPDRVRRGLFEAVASRRGEWMRWDPGLEIRRNDAVLEEGHRFELGPAAGAGRAPSASAPDGGPARDGGGAP